MMKRGTAFLLCLAVAPLLGSVFGAEPESPRRNVILIVIETLRKDHLELYGYEKSTAPNLSALAADSLVFDNAVVQANWTIPSIATIFTSMYPSSHNFIVQHEQASVLSARIPTLPRILKSHGYATGGIQTNMFLTRESGIARGLDHYSRSDAGSAGLVIPRAQSWLQQVQDGPFFLYLHLYDPHAPYVPPQGLARRFRDDAKDLRPEAFFPDLYEHIFLFEDGQLIRDLNHYRAAYDASIWNMDHELKKLLDFLERSGRMDDTLIAVVADHGEEFGDHGGLDHGYNLYEYMIGAPLFLHFPEGSKGRVRARVGAIDLAPTILDYLDIEPPPTFQGRSFLHLAEEPRGKHQELVFSQGNGIGNVKEHRFDLELEQVCVYRGDHKLIRSTPSGDIELYDLASDPLERKNIAGDHAKLVRELVAELDKFEEFNRENAISPEETIKLDKEELEKLKSLGYSGGSKDE